MKESISAHVDQVGTCSPHQKQLHNVAMAVHAGVVQRGEAMLVSERGHRGEGGRVGGESMGGESVRGESVCVMCVCACVRAEGREGCKGHGKSLHLHETDVWLMSCSGFMAHSLAKYSSPSLQAE